MWEWDGACEDPEGLKALPVPRSRYLMAVCVTGQMSNRLKCIQDYFGLAALLNRTLLLPERDLGGPPLSYYFPVTVDVSHAQWCLGGGKRVMALEEYLAELGRKSADVEVGEGGGRRRG